MAKYTNSKVLNNKQEHIINAVEVATNYADAKNNDFNIEDSLNNLNDRLDQIIDAENFYKVKGIKIIEKLYYDGDSVGIEYTPEVTTDVEVKFSILSGNDIASINEDDGKLIVTSNGEIVVYAESIYNSSYNDTVTLQVHINEVIPLEYIGTFGGNYVNTKAGQTSVKENSNGVWKISCKFRTSKITEPTYIFGVKDVTPGNKEGSLFIDSNKNLVFAMCGNTTISLNPTKYSVQEIEDDTIYEFNLTNFKPGDKDTDIQLPITTVPSLNWINPYPPYKKYTFDYLLAPYYMFAMNNNDTKTPDHGGLVYIYYLKFTGNSTSSSAQLLNREFKPVLFNNVPMFYDEINGLYYKIHGVNPIYYKKLDEDIEQVFYPAGE